MKKRWIGAIVMFAMVRGCMAILQDDGSHSTASNAPQVKSAEVIKTPWKWSIESKREAGAKIQGSPDFEGKTETLEAAGKWLVVMMSLENASTTRQSAKDIFVLSTAQINDSEGKVHDVDMDASELDSDKLEEKPFKPGESRSVKLAFDIPQAAKPKTITILGTDEQKKVKKFIINLQ